MLVDVLEELLEQADNDNNVEDEQRGISNGNGYIDKPVE